MTVEKEDREKPENWKRLKQEILDFIPVCTPGAQIVQNLQDLIQQIEQKKEIMQIGQGVTEGSLNLNKPQQTSESGQDKTDDFIDAIGNMFDAYKKLFNEKKPSQETITNASKACSTALMTIAPQCHNILWFQNIGLLLLKCIDYILSEVFKIKSSDNVQSKVVDGSMFKPSPPESPAHGEMSAVPPPGTK